MFLSIWCFKQWWIQAGRNRRARPSNWGTSFNPILTGGGGGSIWPPYEIRDRRRSRHAFSWVFSFKSYASFDAKFAKIGREVTWRFVLARRHKICPKSAFCICLCTKHMEITDFLKMHYNSVYSVFLAICTISYILKLIKIKWPQKKKSKKKKNEIHKK